MAQKMTLLQKVAIGIAAVCAGFVVVLIVLFGDDHAQREAEKAAQRAEESQLKACADTTMAYIMSRRFVERELVAPSTAKFPSALADGVHSVQSEDCKFSVVAYVDAQNSLGATVRTRYSIEMEYFPDRQSWLGRNLQIQ